MKLILASLLFLTACQTTVQEDLKDRCEGRGGRYNTEIDPVFIGTCVVKIKCEVKDFGTVSITITEFLKGNEDDFTRIDTAVKSIRSKNACN